MTSKIMQMIILLACTQMVDCQAQLLSLHVALCNARITMKTVHLATGYINKDQSNSYKLNSSKINKRYENHQTSNIRHNVNANLFMSV